MTVKVNKRACNSIKGEEILSDEADVSFYFLQDMKGGEYFVTNRTI
jgi:hypothetical protein